MKNNSLALFVFFGILLLSNRTEAQLQADTLHYHRIAEMGTLKLHNYFQLGDLLNLFPGADVRDLRIPGQWISFRIRCCNENQVTVLLDGHPFNDPWSGMADLNWIPVEMIREIQVYPSGNPFGIHAVGGVVNLVTRDVPGTRPYTCIVYRSGKDKFSDLNVTFGQKLTEKWEILSGILYKKYGAERPDRSYSARKIYSKMTYHPFDWLRIKYTILYNKSDVDLVYNHPVQGDSILGQPHRDIRRTDHFLNTRFLTGILQTDLGVNHTDLRYELAEYRFYPAQTIPVKNTELFIRQSIQLSRLPIRWTARTQWRQLSDSTDTKKQDRIWQFGIGSHVQLPGNLKWQPQLSCVQSTGSQWYLLLNSGMNWQPSDKIRLWLNYEEGLREPTLGEQTGFIGAFSIPESENAVLIQNLSETILPNPALEPEQSKAFEAGFAGLLWNRFRWAVSGSFRDSRDLIQGIRTPEGYQFQNLAKARFQGLETRFSFPFLTHFHSDLILHLQKAVDENEEDLLESPNLKGMHSLSWKRSFFEGDLTVSLFTDIHFWSNYLTITGESVETAVIHSAKAGVLLNMKLNLRFKDQVIVFFAMDNLFGSRIYRMADFILPVRTHRFGISWELFD